MNSVSRSPSAALSRAATSARSGGTDQPAAGVTRRAGRAARSRSIACAVASRLGTSFFRSRRDRPAGGVHRDVHRGDHAAVAVADRQPRRQRSPSSSSWSTSAQPCLADAGELAPQASGRPRSSCAVAGGSIVARRYAFSQLVGPVRPACTPARCDVAKAGSRVPTLIETRHDPAAPGRGRRRRCQSRRARAIDVRLAGPRRPGRSRCGSGELRQRQARQVGAAQLEDART